jgi:16S rRNA (uracil1498-N3)-methyltransferase
MSVPRFHCARTLVAGERTALPDDVFHHAARVRRLRVGEEIILFAGDGVETRARLTAVTRTAAEIAILDVRQVERESPLPVTLIQGISAGDRMDYTLQKAVELGIAAIVPAFAERSVVRLTGERADKRRMRWQEVVISACEQSGRNRIPVVAPAADLDRALADASAAPFAQRYVLSVEGGARLRDLPRPSGPIALLAGPEGGLTPLEEGDAKRAGFAPLSLGPRVLRTETAAVAALAAMQALWGDR